MGSGILYVVATPIGNLEDITLRALRVLKEVDLIASEDTRRTLKLLSRYGISKKLLSYNEYNSKERTDTIVKILKEGKSVALVSDAGTPCISDPGSYLVKRAREEEIKIVPVPGPSSVITAMSVSGLNFKKFFFAGFLPTKGNERARFFEEIRWINCPVIFFESPHRIISTITEIEKHLGDCELLIFRELTKFYEEILAGRPQEIKEKLEGGGRVKGEFLVLLDCRDVVEPSRGELVKIVAKLISLGFTKDELIDTIRTLKEATKKEVYQAIIKYSSGGEK